MPAMSEAPSLCGQAEELDDWAALARNALAVVREQAALDESRARSVTIKAPTRPASVDESSAARPLAAGRMVRSTPTSTSDGMTVSSSHHARRYSVPTVNSLEGELEALPSNGENNTHRRTIAWLPSFRGANNTSAITQGDNGHPASDNNVRSVVDVIPAPRPLPRPPTMYDTPSRAASRLTAASGSTPHPATSPVPYSTVSAVEGALFKPTPVRSPTIANSVSGLSQMEKAANGASSKRWRGGDIVGTAKARLVTLQPRHIDIDIPASKDVVAGPSAGFSPRQGNITLRHWMNNESNLPNLPANHTEGSTAGAQFNPTWEIDPRARYSVSPPRLQSTIPSTGGRDRTSAPPPSRNSDARIRANSATDDSTSRARYRAPPPHSFPHASPRRTRSRRRTQRLAAPVFRGETVLLEPLPPLRYPRLSSGLVNAVCATSFPPLPPTPSVNTFQDAFQRLIATYGDLLPHRPKSRMEAINLIFAAAADMPEEEGGTVAAMVMEAFRSIKTEQCKSAASQVSRSSGERRESSERENLERKNETEDERSTPVEPIADPYTKLLERYSHLLPLGASGPREKILETLLGAAVELPDGQRETAIQAIMEVYEAASATSAGGGASVHGPSDPYDLLVLQYGHLIPGSNHANRAETFDALLLAATELSDGEGSLVARLVLEAHDVSASGTQGSSTHRSSVDTRRSALSSSLTEDPFQRLMAEYGHLLPHRPDTRMATLDLMFVAASALPEAEGELVTVLISEAWEALNAILPVLDQEAADAIAVAEAADAIQGQGEEAESSGDDGDHECEDDRERSDNAEAQGPCPCCGPCGSVCEYEAAIAPQPLPQPVKPRSFRRSRRQRPPSPEKQPEAGPLRPRRSALRSASLDLWIRDRKKFKSGPSGSEGIDMLYAFLEREAAKAEALGNARDKGNGKGKAREAQRVLFADERRQPEDEEAEQLEERRRARQVSVSSGSWDEAELAARGLTEPELEREHEAQERRRWFRRR